MVVVVVVFNFVLVVLFVVVFQSSFQTPLHGGGGGYQQGASGALDGELVMISRCPQPGASSYIVLLLVISSRHMFLYDLRFMCLDIFLYMFTERYIQNGRQKSLLKISKTQSRIPSKTQIEFEKHTNRLV